MVWRINKMTSISEKFLKDTMKLQDDLVRSLFEAIVGRYGIPSEELWELYKKDMKQTSTGSPKDLVASNDFDTDKVNIKDILQMKVTELKALCKIRGLKVGGKKQSLMSRLLGREVNDEEIKSPRKSPKKKKISTKIPVVHTNVNPGEIKITKNANGDFMHAESMLIFDPDTKEVFAKYVEGTGNQPLTKADLEICNQYRFPYSIPDNLNNGADNGDDAQKLAKLLADEEEEVNIARLARAARRKKSEEKSSDTEVISESDESDESESDTEEEEAIGGDTPLEESNTVEEVEESNTVEEVEESNTVEEVEESNTVEEVEEVEEVEIESEIE